MKQLSEIKLQIESLKPTLKAEFSVETIQLFGSYVRGEEKESSDIDILVTFIEPNNVDLFKFIELRLLLKDKLGIDVDLVERDALKPRIRQRVYEEAIGV